MKNPKYELKRNSHTGEWHFVLKAKNGRVVLSSETYEDKGGALNGIDSVRKHGVMQGCFVLKESVDHKHFFVLRAPNNKVIGVSEMYNQKGSAKGTIDAMQKISQTPNVLVLDTETTK